MSSMEAPKRTVTKASGSVKVGSLWSLGGEGAPGCSQEGASTTAGGGTRVQSHGYARQSTPSLVLWSPAGTEEPGVQSNTSLQGWGWGKGWATRDAADPAPAALGAHPTRPQAPGFVGPCPRQGLSAQRTSQKHTGSRLSRNDLSSRGQDMLRRGQHGRTQGQDRLRSRAGACCRFGALSSEDR